MRGLRELVGRGLPTLGTVAPDALGVHSPSRGRHVERDLDDALSALVGSEAPVVLVTGPRLAGTTRSLARAARLVLGDHEVLRLHPSGSRPVSELLDDAAARRRGAPLVVWIEDVPLTLLPGLADPELRVPEGVRVLATVREDLLHPDVAPLPSDAPVVGLGAAVSATEAARSAEAGWETGDVPGRRALDLAAARAALVPGCHGSGEHADRGSVVVRRHGIHSHDPVRAAAVLRAAADWARLAVPMPLSRSTLAELAAAYLGSPGDVNRLARVVDSCSNGRGALLRRERRDDRLHHVPDPRLTAVADDLVGTDDAWTAPDLLAERLEAGLADPEVRRAVAVLALHRHLDTVALALLADVEPGDVTARTAYGVGFAALAADPDEQHDEARRWFSGVVAGGDPEYRPRAAFWVGLERGADPEASRAHLEIVAAEGSHRDVADAAYMLAVLEREAGHGDAQRRWLDVAARAGFAAGDPHRGAEALLEVADLDRRAGRIGDARRGYTEVLDAGDPDCTALARRALADLGPDATTVDVPAPRADEPADTSARFVPTPVTPA